jgi:hypothetical protein
MERELMREKSEDNDDSDDDNVDKEGEKKKVTRNGNGNGNGNGIVNGNGNGNAARGTQNCSSQHNGMRTIENTVRNGGLEFSLYLDDSSTVDLYLELNSGVEKEIDICDLLKNSSNSYSTVSLSDESAAVKNTKKNKFEDSENTETHKILYKKQKTEKLISTHTIFSATENSETSVINNNLASSNTDSQLVEEKQKLLDNISGYFENGDSSYYSKYFDIETKERLTVLYSACTGAGLESLVLSDGMLMLMGYPGCDGEEGAQTFKYF